MKSKVFLLAILLLGIILYMLSTKIENSKCVDDAVRSANKGLVVISVTFVVLSISVLGCQMRCEKIKPVIGSFDQCRMYAIFFLLLGIVLISLGSVILGKVKQCNADASDNIKSNSKNVITIGVIAVVASVGYLGYTYYNKSRPGAVTTSTFDFPSYFN
jgi:NADH:ubiquinone oxidoreductase subunit 6 (subunit J)